MRIIPAIDIIDGQCVRLSQGDFNTKKVYAEDPLEMAKRLEDHGIQYLHLVDLDGAKAGKVVNLKVLEDIASRTNLIVDFGGGVKTDRDIQEVFNCGASQVTAGSIAAKDPELFLNWLSIYGSDTLILGADCNNRKIAIGGWAETTATEVLPFLQTYRNRGVRYTVCTDISKDGMMQGPAFGLYKDIIQLVDGIQLVASGGISTIDDINRLEALGCEGAIIGKAIYEGSISLKELSALLTSNSKLC